MANVKVSRTLISVEGKVGDDIIEAVGNAIDEHDFVDIRHAYDETTGQTKFWLYPCKAYLVEYGEGDEKTESCQRKIIMKGSLPKSLQFTAKHWMPFRKQAKRAEKDTRYVVLTAQGIFKRGPENDSSEANYTEFCLIVDGRCPKENRKDVLNEAANYVKGELRSIVEDASPALMLAVQTMDRVSCDIADILTDLL